MSEHREHDPTAVAMATLSLLEALLLTLRENALLSAAELEQAFDAAIAAHKAQSGADHAEAADILDRLKVNGNSVRLHGKPQL